MGCRAPNQCSSTQLVPALSRAFSFGGFIGRSSRDVLALWQAHYQDRTGSPAEVLHGCPPQGPWPTKRTQKGSPWPTTQGRGKIAKIGFASPRNSRRVLSGNSYLESLPSVFLRRSTTSLGSWPMEREPTSRPPMVSGQASEPLRLSRRSSTLVGSTTQAHG